MKKLFSFVFIITVVFFSKPVSASVVCDTIFNLKSNLDTPTIYIADTTAMPGYVSGNNDYGDLVKGERFAGVAGYHVTAAELFFALVTVNSADSSKTLKVIVYDNTGTAANGGHGAPGHALDSSTITLAQVAQAVTTVNTTHALAGVPVLFTGNAAITDSFFIMVTLPTTTGDTVALFESKDGGPGGDGWEGFQGNNPGLSWGSYVDDWGFTRSGNYIASIICSNPTEVLALDETNAVKIYPNPTNDVLNLQWSQQSNAEVSIISMTGITVRSFVTTGTMLNSYDVHDLAAGAYIVRVTDRSTNQHQSMLFSKF